MGWTLDREFFRLLVGLYLLASVLAVGVAIYEMISPGWRDFSDGFDTLADRHFGTPDDTVILVLGGLFVVSLSWHIVSLIGLAKFRPWARWSFWASMVLATITISIPSMAVVSFMGPLGYLTAQMGAGLFAIILLLAYSRDHGCLWFKGPLETLKETF